MAFDWMGYQELAQKLADNSSDESALRSAISRAYYAAYNKARQRLAQDHVTIPKGTGDLHVRTWSAFRRRYVYPHHQIGVDGDRLRAWRKMADYDDTVRNLDSTARFALGLAGTVLTALRGLPASPKDVLRPPE